MSNEFPGGERGDGGIPIAGEPADEIVGHKTLMDGTHVPLLRAEARELLAAVDRDKRRRESAMPSERDAIVMMWQAYQRLRELGWREAIYCPKDGTWFQAIEPGARASIFAITTAIGPMVDGQMATTGCGRVCLSYHRKMKRSGKKR